MCLIFDSGYYAYRFVWMPILNDNGGLGFQWVFGLFGVLRMELWISFPFEMNMICMDFWWMELSFSTGRKMNEKGKNTNSSNCVQTQPNKLNVERSNMCIHVRLGQRAETSNDLFISSNVWVS